MVQRKGENCFFDFKYFIKYMEVTHWEQRAERAWHHEFGYMA